MKRDYKIIDTREKLEELDSYLTSLKNPLLAFDTETNGLHFHKDVIIGFSLSPNPGEGFYIPLLTWVPNDESKKPRKRETRKVDCFMEGEFNDVWRSDLFYSESVTSKEYSPPQFIIDYAAKWLTSTNLLMQNAPFDCCMMLYNFKLDLSANLFCDTALLKHAVDETPPHSLKDTANLWKRDLGFDINEIANAEQDELGFSVFKNGGEWRKKSKEVWRGDYELVGKYACADTRLTYGIFQAGLRRLPEEQHAWFFKEEVMPVCKEVVIPMLARGVYINVKYFEELKLEIESYLTKYENQAIELLGNKLDDFSMGKSIDQVATHRKLIERIIELEGLEYPTTTTKGVIKNSLSKRAVTEAYNKDPHWLWGYILGTDEIKYSDKKLDQIKSDLYAATVGSIHRFNIRSPYHLRWLFFTKLGYDIKLVPKTKSSTKDNIIPSVDASVIKTHFAAEYDFVKPLLIYKKLYKLYSSYIEPALNLHAEGWLRVNMRQNGTISGRFSCSGGFNLQTLPRVEDLSICPECETKGVLINYPIKFLANIECPTCGHKDDNIIVPSVIKTGFISPPGYKILNADYASLEPRCFAFMSGDAGLKDVYKKNLDLYSKVYCDIEDPENKYSPDPKSDNFLKKKNPAARVMVKPVVLGIPYGSRGYQVAKMMGFKDATGRVDIERGNQWIDKYLGEYVDLHKYMLQCEIEAVTDGIVKTIVGRRRHFKYAPIIYKILVAKNISNEAFLDASNSDLGKLKNSLNLDRAAMQMFCSAFDYDLIHAYDKGNWAWVRGLYRNELNNAKNFKIQGLAAHITNLGMLDTMRLFRKRGIEGYVCLQVHDELVCYVREGQVQLAAGLLKQAMENNKYAKLLDIPMEAIPIIADNLKDAK